MRLGLRLFFAFFLIAGVALWFVLRVFSQEIKPSVREVMEDVLVDSANLLAEQVTAEMLTLPPGGNLAGTRFAQAVEAYAHRPVDARIWGLHKRQLDFRVYVTDASGRVVFDSGLPSAARSASGLLPGDVGKDYSRWRDVARTLRGEYGARATRIDPLDDTSSVMYVAAPIRSGNQLLGVLTIGKPHITVAPTIARAEAKIINAGTWLLAVALGVGVAATLWLVRATRRLRGYAERARAGSREAVPLLPGELGDLAQAVGEMRERLTRHDEAASAMRAFTHEVKSPLAAIAASAELLEDPALPAPERERFAQQIGSQVQRLHGITERLLELTKLEGQSQLESPGWVDVCTVMAQVLADHDVARSAKDVTVVDLAHEACGHAPQPPAPLWAQAELLRLALSNLLSNALAFAPPGSRIEWHIASAGERGLCITLRDHGPGVAPALLPRLGERFFSLPPPGSSTRGSGLGLAIVRQIVALHGGSMAFEDAAPGLRVRLNLPSLARA